MVCPHHQVCKSELFIGPFLGQANANNRRSVRIYCVWISIIVSIGSNSGNSINVYTLGGEDNEGMYCSCEKRPGPTKGRRGMIINSPGNHSSPVIKHPEADTSMAGITSPLMKLSSAGGLPGWLLYEKGEIPP